MKAPGRRAAADAHPSARGVLHAVKIVRPGVDGGLHLVEPHLELHLAVQLAALAFPGGHAPGLDLNDCLEHGTAGIGEDARVLPDAAVHEQAAVALQQRYSVLDLPFVSPVALAHDHNAWL